MALCQALTKSGNPCKARAQGGSQFCCFHDPDSKSREKLRAAQARGGKGRRLLIPFGLPQLATIDFENPEPALDVICGAVTSLGRGQLDAKTAHAMFHGIEAACRLYQISAIANIKRRQERIQRLLQAERNRPAEKSEVHRLLRFEPDAVAEIEATNSKNIESNDGAVEPGRPRFEDDAIAKVMELSRRGKDEAKSE